MHTGTIISNSKIEFGTSGARGLVSDFSSSVVFSYVYNFLKHMEIDFAFSSVALGIDNRPSSYEIAQSCAFAILKAGYRVNFYGVLPTPALALQGLSSCIPAVMVTGSHIPFDRNGLKFYRPDGEINKKDEYHICNANYIVNADLAKLPKLIESSAAKENYMSRYINIFSPTFLSGKHIGIYEHSSSGRDIYAKLFENLGAKVTPLERSDTFVPIDTEAVSQVDRDKAVTWSKDFHFDAIFSTDGDGDRPLVADENGEWLRGDILGLLAAHALNVQAIAIPVSCNSSIELSNLIPVVKRTKIGSPFVIEAFGELLQTYSCVAGFEANGGFLLASDIIFDGKLLQALPTRDAVLPFLMLLYYAKNETITKCLDRLPKRFSTSDRVSDFNKDNSNKIINLLQDNQSEFISKILDEEVYITDVDFTDGIKMKLGTGDFIHFRPSGNAPEFRCYVESACAIRAKLVLKKLISFLKNYNLTC